MSTHVLLTGASGFIGFRILQSLLVAGHRVRFTARSQQKVDVVCSNPALQKLNPGDRVTGVIIPDVAADGAFDQAMQGITHVLHVGSPVPTPDITDGVNKLYLPTLRLTANILNAALKTPSVKRVIITSTLAAQMPLDANPDIIGTPSSRMQLNDGGVPPSAFENPMHAYATAKIHDLHHTETFMQTQSPHFTCAHVFPGYVYGRNELLPNAQAALTENSSNMFLIAPITGNEAPTPVHGSFAHIDDVVDVHIKTLFPETEEAASLKSFSISSVVHYDEAFPIVQKTFPQAVADGALAKGKIITIPVNYDASETERALGIKFKPFESAVTDLAGQYLELLGKAKA